jgi:hypothetical protein
VKWLHLFAQQNPLPTSPGDIVRGVNEGGAIWVLAVVAFGAVGLCLWLGRTLLAKNEQIALIHSDYGKQLEAKEAAHGLKIEALYKDNAAVARAAAEVSNEIRDMLVKLNDRFPGRQP